MATGRQVRARSGSLARLRRWLVAGLILLLLVLGGLLGYARYRARRFMADIPRRLGINIKSETDGFTLSQSVKGRTVFTLHAAKAIQHENGKTTLHNVAITLFGPPGSNRTDGIRGDDFEYDQPNGVVQAVGEVHLDLASPAQPSAPAKNNARRIVVTTRGLVYLQKLGVAATNEPLQIVYGDMRGSAIGADYDSDQGTLRLRKDVHMDGTQDGKPLHLTASDAELDRTQGTARLHAAHVQTGDSHAAGDLMTVHMSKDGNIESVDADGHATLGEAGGVQAESGHLVARMTPAGKLQTAAMDGGVHFKGDGSSGGAGNALLHFDAAGKPVQLDLLHAVNIDSIGTSGEQDTLTADRAVAHLVQDGRRTSLHDATASGNATLHSAGTATPKGRDRSPGTGAQTTVVRADELHAITALAGMKRYIAAIDGTGNTHIDQTSATGEVRSSSGDVLHATLLSPGGKADANASGQLQTATQTGHVVVTQHVPPASATVSAGAKPAQDTRATAKRAEFDAATQRLLLTGAPVVTAPGVQLAADRLSMNQGSGDTEATGSVKGTFVQAGTSSSATDLVHVLADRAVMAGSGGTAHFYGGSKPARMWSSTAQLDAPVLDLDRTGGTLAAHDAGGGGLQTLVHLSLPATAKAAARGRRGAVQIAGRQLTITAATAASPGQLVMTGQTLMRTGETSVTADRIVAELRAAATKESSARDKGSDLLNSGIDSLTATGNVALQQPGRSGTGAKLLYTSADERYQLTGTPSTPPRIADSARGTVTGTSLIFHGEDDSVEVAGEAGRRVHTETDAGSGTRSR